MKYLLKKKKTSDCIILLKSRGNNLNKLVFASTEPQILSLKSNVDY